MPSVLSLALMLSPLAPQPEDARDPGEAGSAQEASELEAMKKRVEHDETRMHFLVNEETSIMSALEALDRELAHKRARITSLGAESKKLESTIAIAEEEAREQTEALEELRARAGYRVSAMHRLHQTRLRALFRRMSARNQSRRLRDDLSRVLAYDADLLASARSAAAAARSARESAASTKASLETMRDALEQEVRGNASLREERRKMLEAVRKERFGSAKLAAEIVVAAKRLERELGVVRGLSPPPAPAPGGFESQRGRLPWPAPGRIEVAFGKTVDPASGMVMVQKGLDLRGEVDAPVRTVFGGRVAYSDWLEGYGQLIILEHDGGYYTLYAHLAMRAVDRGEDVEAGTMLGAIGDSGSTKGPYLYFEIRKGKDALDPLRWLSP